MAEIDKKELNAWLDKQLKSKDFEKLIKKMVNEIFIQFIKLLYDNRNFLKNK
jgi:hypothetical protein